MIQLLSNKLDLLKAGYIEKYGEVIFEVNFTSNAGTLTLSGTVLLPQQADAAILAAKEVFEGEILNNISVLALTGNNSFLSYGAIKETYKEKPINILRAPVDISGLAFLDQNKFRSTQIMSSDPCFKILWQLNDWYLVKLIDETIGWVEKKHVIQLTGCTPPTQFHYCTINKKTKFDTDSIFKSLSIEKLRNFYSVYLGSPYLLGGTTKQGIDCSGLTQRIYKNALSLIIPKKSTDQLKAFKPLPLDKKNYQLGALVFMEGKKKTQRSHVGIIVDPENENVLHSSLTNKRVQIETFEELKQNYKILSLGILPN